MVPFSASSVCAGTGNTLNINKIKRLMHFLHNQNRLIRLNNKRFIGNDAMDSIRLTVTQTIKARGKLVISDSMELLGYGRSMGIPVFEYLDSIGFTKRIGDYRVLANDGNCSDVTTKPD